MPKPPVIPAILAALIGIFCGVALMDHMGAYRWFGSYDNDVWTAALFGIVLEMIFVIPLLKPWLEQSQAELDRRNDEAP
jgi:hypothetical protein